MTVYADNAATTRMSRTALDAMLPAMEENYGNPSTLPMSILRESNTSVPQAVCPLRTVCPCMANAPAMLMRSIIKSLILFISSCSK